MLNWGQIGVKLKIEPKNPVKSRVLRLGRRVRFPSTPFGKMP